MQNRKGASAHRNRSRGSNTQSAEKMVIPDRHAGPIFVGLAGAGLILFLAGYFMGRRDVAEQLAWGAEEHSFADRVRCAIGQLQGSGHLFASLQEEDDVLVGGDEEGIAPEAILDSDASDMCKRYYAQLVGFGTKRAADSFATRLQDRGWPVLVKRRVSRTPRGILRAWYQVVTEPSGDKEKLDSLVDTIAKVEKLKDVRIVSC